jgi:hypothetical protein
VTTPAEVYRAYVAAETRRDREGMVALLAPDVTIGDRSSANPDDGPGNDGSPE